MMPYRFLIIICMILLSYPVVPATAEERPTVFVSILPQKFFVQQIGRDMFNIEVMVEPGASPHTYEPKPSQMRRLSSSRAYFAIGVSFETAWLDKIAGVNPAMKIVHTEEGIKKIAMSDDHDEEGDSEHDGHSVREAGSHRDAVLDPHIWLAPSLVKRQAATIRDALIGLYPEQAGFFKDNYLGFEKRIEQLDRDMKRLLVGRKNLEFMVFHPSWGYFAREYGLHQVAVEIEGKSPKPAQLKNLIERARKHGIHVVFAQPQFSSKSAEVIAREIDGRVVFVDPLGEDWLKNMREVAENIGQTLR